MDLPTYFEDFLCEVRMTSNQRKEAKKGHETLRGRLTNDEDLKGCIVSTFIQGSYRRATAVRPKGGKRSDVDVIVVTNLDPDDNTPREVLERFKNRLETYYPGKCKLQGRSVGIELSHVDLDVVVTSAPSEAAKQAAQSDLIRNDSFLDEDLNWSGLATILEASAGEGKGWSSEPLQIPDRETQEWQRTDPLAQIAVAAEKNQACNGHFVNVVKALKWWRVGHEELPKYPKGYPFERLITECCPDGISSIAEGVTLTLESFVSQYGYYVEISRVPELPDYGVPEHDVLKRVEFEDFEKLFRAVEEAAAKARAALDEQDKNKSVCLWRDLFGGKFPEPPGGCTKQGSDDSGAGAGFSEPTSSSDPGRKRFA